ncbi:glutamine synthetase family protein [Actinoplanes sp. NPDC051346]|uniref:glutamine synthetase family protein n=1 Tax=Actinoplanes sp. NPDC051346 TaxID=3155048 RepID=UPI00341DD639
MTEPHFPGDGSRRFAGLSTGSRDFVARHAVWNDQQRAAAEDLERRLGELDLVRVVFGDPHGLARSKTLTVSAFRSVLRNGMDYSPGPFIFDTGHNVAVDFFAAGGGLGIPELTGAGDFIVVPDPSTFRVLPHTAGARVGWVIGDEYLRSGQPHPLSGRAVLREVCARLAHRDLDGVVGLEVEWYLTKVLPGDVAAQVGGFGVQGEAPAVAPVNGGYQFNLDAFTHALGPILEPLAAALTTLGLPLRTMEHESGPGQLEFTFDPLEALAAADAMLLFRTVTKQITAQHGYHASFMALPGLRNFDPSGWHLHQSLAYRSSGRNAFAAEGRLLSELGEHYLAGLLSHAAETAMLAVPTVNGFRRLSDEFSLSPDRVVWTVENRGSLLRVLGGDGDAGTHVENRIGEPCANPYLYIASQISAGLAGIDAATPLDAAATDPHSADAPALPTTLGDALELFRKSELLRGVLGDALTECLHQLKTSEWQRFRAWQDAVGADSTHTVSDWEQREYFAIY